MKKKILSLSLVLVSLGLLFVVILGSNNETNVFYWGTTCPHCHEVIEWMEENNIEQELNITRKEVYENQENAADLSKKAESCGMDTSRIGVPFLYTNNGNCIVGTPDIINYFENQVKQSE